MQTETQSQTQNQKQNATSEVHEAFHLPEALKKFPAAIQIAERVEAARARVQTEFHDRAVKAQARLTETLNGSLHLKDNVLKLQNKMVFLQDKAVTLVEKAQDTALKAQDRARAEKDDLLAMKDEATQKVESLLTNVEDKLAKLPVLDLENKNAAAAMLHERSATVLAAWLKLPSEVRTDVLTVAGVATAAQVSAVHEEIVALRAEMHAHLHPAQGHLPGSGPKFASPRRRARKDESPAEA